MSNFNKILKEFLEERPAISKAGLAQEIGIHRNNILWLIKDQRTLGKDTEQKALAILEKYGYKPEQPQPEELQPAQPEQPASTGLIELLRKAVLSILSECNNSAKEELEELPEVSVLSETCLKIETDSPSCTLQLELKGALKHIYHLFICDQYSDTQILSSSNLQLTVQEIYRALLRIEDRQRQLELEELNRNFYKDTTGT